jgi:hypothetical protein
MSNYKPAFILAGESKPSVNALVFATYEEAQCNAMDKFAVWTQPISYLVIETEDAANYRYDFTKGETVLLKGGE